MPFAAPPRESSESSEGLKPPPPLTGLGIPLTDRWYMMYQDSEYGAGEQPGEGDRLPARAVGSTTTAPSPVGTRPQRVHVDIGHLRIAACASRGRDLKIGRTASCAGTMRTSSTRYPQESRAFRTVGTPDRL